MAVLALCLGIMLLSMVSAHKSGFGSCPKPEAMKNFDEAKFFSVGTWFVLYKLKSKADCLTAAMYRDSDGKLQWRERILKTMGSYSTVVNISSPMEARVTSGRYKLTYGFWPGQEMTVLDTDYKTWAVIYKCMKMPFNIAHRKSASILVTDKNFNDKEKLNKMFGLVKNSGAEIDIDDMDKINHSDCISPKDADFVFNINDGDMKMGGKKGNKILKKGQEDMKKMTKEIKKMAIGADDDDDDTKKKEEEKKEDDKDNEV